MANTIQIKRGTGTSVPSSLAEGELAINLDSGKLFYGSGSSVLSDFKVNTLTAETYVVSSSVTHMTTSFSSGSTAFGDSTGDTHTFTGDITASGNISSSGDIFADDITAADLVSAARFGSSGITSFGNSADDTHTFTGAITASGDISASANIYAADYFDNGANINTIYSPIAGGSGIVTVGALGAGTIASGFGNIDNGSSTLDTGVATVASLVCTADATFGGGYGSTGATISSTGAINADSGITCAGTVMITGGASVGGRILIREGTDNGTHYIGFNAPAAVTANTSFILPDGDGSANQVLKTDGSATLSWTDMSGGTVGWHGSGTRIKILHSDFIADDGGRPIMIDDTGVASEELFLESFSSNKLYATVAIPTGYTATHVMIYGSATDAVEVWEHQINSKTGVSKGTGNVDTEIDIVDVASSTTNYLFIQVANASGNEIHGGYVTIAES
jgi:hypothetical protein